MGVEAVDAPAPQGESEVLDEIGGQVDELGRSARKRVVESDLTGQRGGVEGGQRHPRKLIEHLFDVKVREGLDGCQK